MLDWSGIQNNLKQGLIERLIWAEILARSSSEWLQDLGRNMIWAAGLTWMMRIWWNTRFLWDFASSWHSDRNNAIRDEFRDIWIGLGPLLNDFWFDDSIFSMLFLDFVRDISSKCCHEISMRNDDFLRVFLIKMWCYCWWIRWSNWRCWVSWLPVCACVNWMKIGLDLLQDFTLSGHSS